MERRKFLKKAGVSALAVAGGAAALAGCAPEKKGDSAEVASLKKEYGLSFPFYFADQTTVKTIVRSNPGILRLEEGVIRQKLHFNDLDELELRELSDEERTDRALRRRMDSIPELDQGSRP